MAGDDPWPIHGRRVPGYGGISETDRQQSDQVRWRVDPPAGCRAAAEPGILSIQAVRFSVPGNREGYLVTAALRVADHDLVTARAGGRNAVPSSDAPRLQVFPPEDVAFRRFVQDAHDAMLADTVGRPRHAMDPGELQWRLRERYPAAVVRRRDPLADPAEDDVVWYVYRFGSVSPGRRWWEEPGHAWAILDDERRFLEVASSIPEITEVPREAMIGQPVEAFSNPDDVTAARDVKALWDELLRRGELHATLRFRRADGTPRQIEYHVTWDGAGEGRHLAIVREIDPG